MPRDFDEMLTDDREFTIGGETFHWRYLHWREFATAIDLEVDRRKEETPEGVDPEDNDTVVESYERVIDRVVLYLVPGDVDRFRKLMDDVSKPIPTIQINELGNWLVEAQTARPTEPPSASTGGRGKVVAISKAG